MSRGGPEVAYREGNGTITAECSEESDVCEFGEHAKCSGRVEHRMSLNVVDRATGDVVGATTAWAAGHMCNCRCHLASA